VLALDPDVAAHLLADDWKISGRHRNLLEEVPEARVKSWNRSWRLTRHFQKVQRQVLGDILSEYSVEASALFNPSIVPAPQPVRRDERRLALHLSLRAVGEGQYPQLTFRGGTIAADGSLTVDQLPGSLQPAGLSWSVPSPTATRRGAVPIRTKKTQRRVIFPVTVPNPTGIEDARFVEFTRMRPQDHTTPLIPAYNGKAITIRMIETRAVLSFRMVPCKASAARNKGWRCSRGRDRRQSVDRSRARTTRTLFDLFDDMHRWAVVSDTGNRNSQGIVQIGNCGSPIEVDEAGDAYARRRSGPKIFDSARLATRTIPQGAGAFVERPAESEPSEREGYVPNWSILRRMRQNDQIILPYAVYDTYSNFANIKMRTNAGHVFLITRARHRATSRQQ